MSSIERWKCNHSMLPSSPPELTHYIVISHMLKGVQANFSPTKKTDMLWKLAYFKIYFTYFTYNDITLIYLVTGNLLGHPLWYNLKHICKKNFVYLLICCFLWILWKLYVSFPYLQIEEKQYIITSAWTACWGRRKEIKL